MSRQGRFPLTLTTRVADAHMEVVHALGESRNLANGAVVRALLEEAAARELDPALVAALDFGERVDEAATAAMHEAARQTLGLDGGPKS